MTVVGKAVGLPETEDDRNICVLWNVSNYWPIDTAEDLNLQHHQCQNRKNLPSLVLAFNRPVKSTAITRSYDSAKLKVNVSLYRPLRLQEIEVTRISRQSAHEGDNVVSRTHRPPLPPKRYLLYSVLFEAENVKGPCAEIIEYHAKNVIYIKCKGVSVRLHSL